MFLNLNRRTASANRDSLVDLGLQWRTVDRAIVAAASAGADVDELCDRVDEIEKRIAAIVPVTITDVIMQARLLKSRLVMNPSKVDDRLIDNILTGLEAMAVAGS